jgi:hypothetical protein
MKFLPVIFLFPFAAVSQDISGVWVGNMYNDTTRENIHYELAINESDGKADGYSHTTFVINGVKNIGVKSIKIKIKDDRISIADEKFIYNNYVEPPAKGVRMFSDLMLSENDSAEVLSGAWRTNATKIYRPLTGTLFLEKKRKIKPEETIIVVKLIQLGLSDKLSFLSAKNMVAINNKSVDQEKNIAFVSPSSNNEETENLLREKKAKEELTKGEQIKAQIAKEDSLKAEQIKTQKAQEDIAKAEQAKAQKANEDSLKSEEIKIQKAKEELTKSEELKIQKGKEDSAKAEQIKIQKAQEDIAKAEQAKAQKANEDSLKSEEIKIQKAKEELTKSEELKIQKGKEDSAKAEQIKTQKAQKDITKAEQANAQKDKEETAKAEQLKVQKAKDDLAKEEQEKAQKNKDDLPIAEQLKTQSVIPKAAADIEKRKIETIRTVEISQDSLVFSLYDNGTVDGDTVSVLLNGKVIWPRVGLLGRAINKTIYLTPEMGDSISIILYAENLGSIPPNTGLLVIREAERIYEIRFSGDLNKNSGIVLIRKKKE